MGRSDGGIVVHCKVPLVTAGNVVQTFRRGSGAAQAPVWSVRTAHRQPVQRPAYTRFSSENRLCPCPLDLGEWGQPLDPRRSALGLLYISAGLWGSKVGQNTPFPYYSQEVRNPNPELED